MAHSKEKSERGQNVVAVIGFRDTTIFALGAAPGERSERVVAPDPQGHFHKVHHGAGNPNGTYEDDNSTYWETITTGVGSADAILTFGHGRGKANASHHWIAYVEKHHPDVAAKLVGDVRTDIDHLDQKQLRRLAHIYFDEAQSSQLAPNRQDAS